MRAINRVYTSIKKMKAQAFVLIACTPMWCVAETAIYQTYPGAPNGGGSTSAGAMWGTGLNGSSVGSDLGSGQMHQLNGMSAGYEQAARKSLLMAPGNSITIQSIGTQTIVNSSIYGNNLSMTTEVDVTSNNAGQIGNEATVTNTNNQ